MSTRTKNLIWWVAELTGLAIVFIAGCFWLAAVEHAAAQGVAIAEGNKENIEQLDEKLDEKSEQLIEVQTLLRVMDKKLDEIRADLKLR